MMNYFSALVLFLGCSLAHAEGGKFSQPNNPKWKAECGSCHIAYPPRLLTAGDWGHVMGSLDKHFGANATLDAKDAEEILDFLRLNAGSGSRHAAATFRISDTEWFAREHHEISAGVWSNPAIKSRANCTACHINAEKGDWSERGVRMPKGISREHD